MRAVAATGIERVKFATSFPRDFNDDIVDVIESHDNVCNWVHLPVQSGSSRILAAMKRGHTISLTTDIIVGFPGETEDDFQATIKMVEYCGFDSAYIFKYSPRPGTPAFEMADDVSPEEKTRRFIELENTQKRIQSNNLQRYLNKVLKVLVERPSTRTDGGLTGHSTCQKLVNFVGTTDMIGEIVDVRVTQIKTNSLFGVPV